MRDMNGEAMRLADASGIHNYRGETGIRALRR